MKKFSILRNSKNGTGTSVQSIECNTLIDNIKQEPKDNLIRTFRELFLSLNSPEGWDGYKKIPRVCAVSEYGKNKQGNLFWKGLTGVCAMEICGINNALELKKAKKAVENYPQVLAAFCGADGYSLVVLTLSSLPNGALPRAEEEALAFVSKAYTTSVMCLQPTLEFQIKLQEPTLDSSFLMTYDPEPYYNPEAIPFIFEQDKLTEKANNPIAASQVKGVGLLHNLKPGYSSFATYRKVFNACYGRALNDAAYSSDDADEMIVRVAEECADVNLPQEETTVRLHHYFHEVDIEDIRAMVQNVYRQKEDSLGRYVAFSKHQMVAYRLREFLDRRYDIRFNEVMQMTEFRERQSLVFVYRELNRRELNTIHHEALIEGIEPTFGEIDEMVHSSRVPTYNPIEEYLRKLPRWDGRDHISALAGMVPTDNPHWARLFRQWFLSMVAHWMNGEERHANSTAPILIGAQGFRKSTFCRMLLPPELQMFYTDSIDFRSNVEAERMLSRFMLVNIDEFDQLSEKQFAFVKHLFQKPASNIRRMYSETIASQRRYASFIGTTNSDEVLRDPTGNRRYLCVFVTDKIRTEQQINYSQLYAQAVELINRGERYWINDEDENLIRETNSRFEVNSPLELLFLSIFHSKEETTIENGNWLSSTEIMEALQSSPAFNRKTDNNLIKLGKVLTKIGIEKRHRKNGSVYLVRKR